MTFIYLRGGADNSLAQPGRKKATATKLGIYSTYSPRSSILFLARCSNFCKPLKQNSEDCPSNQVSAAAMTSASEEKWRSFNFFFQSREQVVSRQGQIWRIGWVIKTLEARKASFFWVASARWTGALSCKKKTAVWRFSFKMSFNCQHHQGSVILLVDSLALWEIINEDDAVLIRKIEARTFPADFSTRNFLEWGGMSHYVATPLIVALSPGHSSITRFRP